MDNKCECSNVNNRNRLGKHFKVADDNDFTEEEVSIVKKLWQSVGSGEMTYVYKCKFCGQLWGASPAGHGWMSYRRLASDYEYKQL